MLTISVATRPGKKDSMIFFVGDRTVVAAHAQPLFNFLEKDERGYLQKVASAIKLKEHESRTVLMPGTGRKVILVGAGSSSVKNSRGADLAMRSAVQAARQEKIADLSVWAGAERSTQETINHYETIAAGAVMANFEFTAYKTPPPDGFFFLKKLTFVSSSPNAAIREGLRRGTIVGEETNECRTLSNTPGADMTPRKLAAHALKVSRAHGIKATVFDEKKIKALGMGGLLGVGMGSDEPPRFIIMEYLKGPKGQKPVVLVGKGVTFDTGGLNLKPSEHIYEMHMDMSGGAAVIHTIAAAARLKLKKNIVALIPAAENMPSGSSYHPGDLLRTLNGKTIEVLNTDAEGRVIMADALEYAKRYKPSLVIDVATLTGAVMVALGMHYTGLFSTDEKLEKKFRELGDAVNERVWPLPLSADYEDGIRGTFGDWANAGRPGEGGGASNGAVFLWQFIKGYPWVHLDIASRMTTIKQDLLAKGAAGTPVRLLARFLSQTDGE